MHAILSSLAFAAAAAAQGLEVVTPAKGPFDKIPILGLGTYQMKPAANASESVAQAIEMGYRSLDAAAIYESQKWLAPGIQDGIKRAKIRREDMWITSKLWNDRHSDCALGLSETLTELKLDYLDLYLMHFPVGSTAKIGAASKFDHVETWKCMEKLVKPLNATGPRTRFIGVSNLSPRQLDEILASNPTIKPFVHQMELHPYLQQNDWVARHKKEGIALTAYMPFGNLAPIYQNIQKQKYGAKGGPPLSIQNEVITSIATARGCSPSQVVLAWNMQRGISVIPKSVQLGHQRENLEAREKCKLEEGDMQNIAGLSEMPDMVFRINNPCNGMGANFTPMKCFEGLEADPYAGQRPRRI